MAFPTGADVGLPITETVFPLTAMGAERIGVVALLGLVVTGTGAAETGVVVAFLETTTEYPGTVTGAATSIF